MTTWTLEAEGPREWDAFVEESANGTWLHSRAFLRLQDNWQEDLTAVCRDEHGRILAGIGGRWHGGEFISHPRSTYGGLLFRAGMGVVTVTEIVRSLRAQLPELFYEGLRLRLTPGFLRRAQDESDFYALHRFGSRTSRMTAGSVLRASDVRLTENRRRQLKKAERLGVWIDQDPSVAEVHLLVSENLRRHEVAPVHSVEQLENLKSLGPRVSFLAARTPAGEMGSALVLFRFEGVVHTQYLASHDELRREGLLDYLIWHVIEHSEPSTLISFGISTSPDGCDLNEGLFRFKESWGATTVTLTELLLGPEA